jgi:hypothetical protein
MIDPERQRFLDPSIPTGERIAEIGEMHRELTIANFLMQLTNEEDEPSTVLRAPSPQSIEVQAKLLKMGDFRRGSQVTHSGQLSIERLPDHELPPAA